MALAECCPVRRIGEFVAGKANCGFACRIRTPDSHAVSIRNWGVIIEQ